MRDDNGLTIPGTEGDTWEELEDEDPFMRCILCMEVMPKSATPMHDCDIIPWEEV